VQHEVSYKVYYEDTDSLGVVYYANYFKFMERGRTELLGAYGKTVEQYNREGVLIVVHEVKAKFRKAAVLGDLLTVVSTLTIDSRFRGIFHQRIERDGDLIVDGEVSIVCIDADQQLIEFPADLRELAATP
jgi:tol-pal system-associated acyl-CoA thioesterase